MESSSCECIEIYWGKPSSDEVGRYAWEVQGRQRINLERTESLALSNKVRSKMDLEIHGGQSEGIGILKHKSHGPTDFVKKLKQSILCMLPGPAGKKKEACQ